MARMEIVTGASAVAGGRTRRSWRSSRRRRRAASALPMLPAGMMWCRSRSISGAAIACRSRRCGMQARVAFFLLLIAAGHGVSARDAAAAETRPRGTAIAGSRSAAKADGS